jgi:hypothetical protein
MIIECIKQGFSITHKNWQIILIKAITSVINLIALFVFVGLPIAIGIIVLGIDIAQAKDILPDIAKNPMEFISRYMGVALIFVISLIAYLLIVSVTLLYIFSGTLGSLRNAVLEMQYKFSYSSFFKEAKRGFFPLLWLFSITTLIIIGLLILFGLLSGIFISLTGLRDVTGTTLSVFLTYFLTLMGIAVAFGGIIYSAYAAVALVVEKKGVMRSLNRAWEFIKMKPTAFLFYFFLFVSLTVINFAFLSIETTFSTAPLIGYLFLIPQRIIYSIIQSYLNVVMWGSLTVYYIKASGFTDKEPVNISYTI